MSPRWGFKTFGHPVCYKHAAPLGLTGNTRPLNMLGRKTGGDIDAAKICFGFGR